MRRKFQYIIKIMKISVVLILLFLSLNASQFFLHFSLFYVVYTDFIAWVKVPWCPSVAWFKVAWFCMCVMKRVARWRGLGWAPKSTVNLDPPEKGNLERTSIKKSTYVYVSVQHYHLHCSLFWTIYEGWLKKKSYWFSVFCCIAFILYCILSFLKTHNYKKESNSLKESQGVLTIIWESRKVSKSLKESRGLKKSNGV